ncbi:carbonic anhydrase 7-like isoform X2 [Gigantopelta aegis]|uniref:carbonic anhydrase 7-like isoform X2 n=1 Tax=Gigantopelta aegis TaxID=1735272 RepID=UPI001B88D576|nr:carbonic anhydrase 7-like isoform X2 [Gigantopelta aegis]
MYCKRYRSGIAVVIQRPDTWSLVFKLAAGNRQSPIDIKKDDATFDPELASKPLVIRYHPEKELGILNTGLCFRVDIKEKSTLEGGPLDSVYRLEQFHAHWGSGAEQGSEHLVDGQSFPVELHFVHWNQNKYSSFTEAVNKDDGLAVLAVFLKVGKEHAGFKVLTENMERIKFKDTSIHLKDDYCPDCLLPNDRSKYWTYPGSLTTPPCYESVTWIVFQEAVEVSEQQITTLRGLRCDKCDVDPIVNNYRPPLPVGSRTVRASFE